MKHKIIMSAALIISMTGMTGALNAQVKVARLLVLYLTHSAEKQGSAHIYRMSKKCNKSFHITFPPYDGR